MNNIILTGFAGTGKTTIGEKLAARVGFPFVDMDWLIEEREGRTIPEIFAEEGEPFFRQRESKLCHEIRNGWRGHVVATGGGTLVDPANLALLSEHNLVVCLDCTLEVIWQRLSQATDRPLLNNPDMEQKRAQLRSLYQQRQPAYARIEHHVDTSTRPTEDIVSDIMRIWSASRHECT
jgi:shikimate kinase